MRLRLVFLAAALVAAAGCSAAATTSATGLCPGGAVCVTGTVRHFDLEGGFWAVRGDDSTTYDPLGGIPAAYRQDGVRVRLTARLRPDVVSVHMAGPIVEILALRRL